MLKGIARITTRLWRQLYPERQVYVRSNGRVRYMVLRPSAQAAVSVFSVFCIMWTAIASANFISSKKIMAARDAQISELYASNSRLLAEVAAVQQKILTSKLDRQPMQQGAQIIAPVPDMVAVVAPAVQAAAPKILPRPRPEVVLREEIVSSAVSSGIMPREKPRRPAFILPPNMTVARDGLGNAAPLAQSTGLSGVMAPQGGVIGYLASDSSMTIVALEKLINQTGLDADTMLRRLDKVRSGTGAEGGPLLKLPSSLQDKYSGQNGPEDWNRPTRQGRLQMLREALFSLPLAEPVDKYYVSSNYGYRRDPFTHAKAFHSGVDMVAPHGTPVRASAPGVVVFAARNGPYGNMVEIDHGNGVKSRYGHLSKITVTRGQKVGLRNLIGLVGNTGRSGTAHLHFEVWFDGKARNPRNFLKAGENVFQRQG